MSDKVDQSEAERRLLLVGAWEKVSKSKCDEIYPDQLEFSDRGLYFGKEGPGSQYHPVLDAGRYVVIDASHLKMSTSNDAEVTYEMSLSKDALTLTDKDGCEFKYRRLKQ